MYADQVCRISLTNTENSLSQSVGDYFRSARAQVGDHKNKLRRKKPYGTRGKLYQCDNVDVMPVLSNGRPCAIYHVFTPDSEKENKCAYCNKRFSHKLLFNSHWNALTEQKSFKWAYCDKLLVHSQTGPHHTRVHTAGQKN